MTECLLCKEQIKEKGSFLQLFLFYTATAKAKGSREILYDDII